MLYYRLFAVHREPAPFIKLDRIGRHIRHQPSAALVSRELLHEREQHTTMAESMAIAEYSRSPKPLSIELVLQTRAIKRSSNW